MRYERWRLSFYCAFDEKTSSVYICLCLFAFVSRSVHPSHLIKRWRLIFFYRTMRQNRPYRILKPIRIRYYTVKTCVRAIRVCRIKCNLLELTTFLWWCVCVFFFCIRRVSASQVCVRCTMSCLLCVMCKHKVCF